MQVAEKYMPKLHSAHQQACPWARQACEESLLSYPPIPQAQVIAAFESRLAQFQKLSSLPSIAEQALTLILQTHRFILTAISPSDGTAVFEAYVTSSPCSVQVRRLGN